jgi:uncharacterized OB-fold protein
MKEATMANQRPVAEGIFSWPPDRPHLIGSCCTNCGNYMFPVQSGCSKCTGSETERVELSRRGTLWTWTVQGFPPKSPPFAGEVDPDLSGRSVSAIELPGEVKVEARLTESDPTKLRIGMEMELVLVPLSTDADGTEVMTFAFRPTSEGIAQ